MRTERPTCRECACAKVCEYCIAENERNLDEKCVLKYWENYFVPKREWISVEERLPEDVYGKDRKKITVLVCTEGGKVSTTSRQRIVKFNKTKLEWVELETFEWSKRKRVTHWMPLPEAPKMKGGAQK